MKRKILPNRFLRQAARFVCVAWVSAGMLAPGSFMLAQQGAPAPAAAQQSTTIAPEQLEALVAPIALYPDNLLAQVLVASTYPLELVQLYQWLQKNPDLAKDQKKLAEKVQKQPWDPSVQAMAAVPDTVKWLVDDIQWTTDLGNAFLAQQQDVMNAVQRMRLKAQNKGTLKSSEQMTVQTQTVESKEVIVIQQPNPQVVYVPQYNPVAVYGDPYPAYPYPPVYYPPYYGAGAVAAAGAIGFGTGLIIGAAWGGNWGWNCGWGGGDIDINRNNNFNRNTNISGGNRINNVQGGNRVNPQGGNKWQHNPDHRAGTPYGDRGTADKFGGTTRGDSLANRQRQAQSSLGNRGAGVSDRAQFGGERGNISNRGDLGGGRQGDLGNFGKVSDRGNIGDRGNVGNRGAGVSDRSRDVSNRGGSERIGSRDVSRGSGMSDRSFGGRSDGFSGSNARSSSSRGMSSMSSSRGSFGGASRGSFGGGMSRGGGRRR